MKSEEFEHLVEGATESQRMEFKGPCSWDVVKFAKDILALSNLRDGGYIIVGIAQSQNRISREGITEGQKKTFNSDVMRDQMSEFADPLVDFQVEFACDNQAHEYVVLVIKEFRDLPVVCKKDSKETSKGTIYYRSSHRRPESAQISNSYDMRQILELAALKMMRRWKELKLMVPKSDEEEFDKELKGVEKESVAEKISVRGYWRILFRPLTYNIRVRKLIECQEIVRKNSIDFRGWDYPHFPKDENVLPGSNFYQGTVDWGASIELWRMYQSGQFIHYRALREDWTQEDYLTPKGYKLPAMQFIGVLETLSLMTEIFEFLSRLAQAGLYEEGVNVYITLQKTRNRQLYQRAFVSDGQIHFLGLSGTYKTISDEIEVANYCMKKDVIEKPAEISRGAILNIFEKFGWNPSEEVIKGHQKKLLEGRI